ASVRVCSSGRSTSAQATESISARMAIARSSCSVAAPSSASNTRLRWRKCAGRRIAVARVRERGRGGCMALTRDFKNTVAARAQRDPRFREALLTEAINAFLGGDTAAGKAILRDLVNATLGFEELAAAIK